MAAGSTYTPIATTTLSSSQSSVSFSSISGSYTDLIMIINAKATSSVVNHRIQFNSDTGSNYSWTRLFGNGSSAQSDRGSSNASILIGEVDTTQMSADIVHFQNYANSTTYKTVLTRSGNVSYNSETTVGLWRSTSAITTITIITSSQQFASGSMFTLYGITASA